MEVNNVNFYANKPVNIFTIPYSSPSCVDQILLRVAWYKLGKGYAYFLLTLTFCFALFFSFLVPLNVKNVKALKCFLKCFNLSGREAQQK